VSQHKLCCDYCYHCYAAWYAYSTLLYLGSRDIYTHGDNVTLLCDTDYELVGDNVAQCDSGEWRHPLPYCKEKYCPSDITPISNG